MILIADSGSTKTDWLLADDNSGQTRYNTIGYNPYFINSTEIYNSVSSQLSKKLDPSAVKKIYFYGAGCSTLEKASVVTKALKRCFPSSTVTVKHDMLGAARAVLGDKGGFTAILGTGSNACLYNGKEIEKNIDSLGYLLGDEGSGSYIGRMLLRDYMRCCLPPELQDKFRRAYKYTPDEIYDNLYNKQLPNRFLASFCRFAHDNKDHPYIKQIVKQSFTSFFENIVNRYEDHETLSFNCVGSVGYIFRDILTDVATSYHMKVGKIICSPIEYLTNYHLSKPGL